MTIGSQGTRETQNTGKIFVNDGIQICTESFGAPKEPALFLVMGAMSSTIWWDENFCRLLADRGLFVYPFR